VILTARHTLRRFSQDVLTQAMLQIIALAIESMLLPVALQRVPSFAWMLGLGALDFSFNQSSSYATFFLLRLVNL
jgi:hypothetical protein